MCLLIFFSPGDGGVNNGAWAAGGGGGVWIDGQGPDRPVPFVGSGYGGGGGDYVGAGGAVILDFYPTRDGEDFEHYD